VRERVGSKVSGSCARISLPGTEFAEEKGIRILESVGV